MTATRLTTHALSPRGDNHLDRPAKLVDGKSGIPLDAIRARVTGSVYYADRPRRTRPRQWFGRFDG
jgi:hypothetical protein